MGQNEQGYRDLVASGGFAGSPDAPIPTAEVVAGGPVNAFGEAVDVADYALLTVAGVCRVRISLGAAEVLAAELLGVVERHRSAGGGHGQGG